MWERTTPSNYAELTGIHLGAAPCGMFHTNAWESFDSDGNPVYASTVGKDQGMMDNTIMNGVYFEGVCVAAVLDICTGNIPTFSGCESHLVGMSWGTRQKTSIGPMGPYNNTGGSAGQWGVYTLNALSNWVIYPGTAPFLAGTEGVFYFTGSGPTLFMSRDLIAPNLFGSGTTFATYPSGSACDPSGGVAYTAQVFKCESVVRAGDLVELTSGYVTVTRAMGANPVFGVAMTDSAATGDSVVLVQVSGTQATINTVDNEAGSISGGELLSTSNTVAPSMPWLVGLASSNPGAPVVGLSTQPGGGGSSAISLVQLKLA